MSERFYCVAFADSEQELTPLLLPSARVLAVYRPSASAHAQHFLLECSSVRGESGAIAQAAALDAAGHGLENAHSLGEARQVLEQWFRSELVESRASRFEESTPELGARSRTSGLGA
jgi:hypothetical protein